MEVLKQHVPCLYKEFEHLSPKEVKALYSKVLDRWTWDTGSEEDKKLLEKLDNERWYRDKNKSRKLTAKWTIEAQQDLVSEVGEHVEEELIAAIENEIIKDRAKKLIP